MGSAEQTCRQNHSLRGNAVSPPGPATAVGRANVDPPEGSAGLAGAVVRETLLAGGQACRPLVARDGLSAVLIEPAITLLKQKGASIELGHELREIGLSAEGVGELRFGTDNVALGPDDAVVM